MKAFKSIKPLNETQQRGVAVLTSQLISTLFKDKVNKSEILDRISSFFRNDTSNELIAKQSLTKALLNKTTWKKTDIIKANNLSPKICCESATEKSDTRAITEALTMDSIAENHKNIKKITLLSENDNKQNSLITLSNTNKNPDGKIYIKSDIDYNLNFLSDVKSGHNSMALFSHIASVIPLTSDDETYSIINTELLTPARIQNNRLKHFSFLQKETSIHAFEELKQKCLLFREQEKNITACNILIQEEMLKFIGDNPAILSYFKPSLYSFKLTKNDFVHEEFYNALKPFITRDIFDNKFNAHTFVKFALIAYDMHIKNISQNVTYAGKSWGDSGLENIAEDIFH